jgi:uncharacterized membrane protein YhaH (DUF805 family)
VDWIAFYISPYGRASRKSYWLYFILAFFSINVVVYLIEEYVLSLPSVRVFGDPYGYLSLATEITLAWPTVVISIKRFHDINLSGWWLLTFVPFYLWYPDSQSFVVSRMADNYAVIVLLVFLGLITLYGAYLSLLQLFKAGTSGENQYGPDPLGANV